jgi:hypothetical protein
MTPTLAYARVASPSTSINSATLRGTSATACNFLSLPSDRLLPRLAPAALGRQRTPGTESQLSRDSDCLYACGFRIYFTPLPGFFSPFPHGTGSLSVDHEYLALEDGPPIFRQDVTCPALLVSRLVPHSPLQLRGCHPLRPAFPDRSPEVSAKSRRLLPFRSPLLWESRLISVPPAT